MANILSMIRRAKIISPRGLYYLFGAIVRAGANLGALVAVGAKLYGNLPAINVGRPISYIELHRAVERMASMLYVDGVRRSQRVAVAGHNDEMSVVVIVALGRLGVNVYLVDGHSSDEKLAELKARHHFHRVIRPSDCTLCDDVVCEKAPRGGSARLTVLTSGTTGASKAASRKTGLGDFLPPFIALLIELRLTEYRSLYIATPLHHGFGIATLCVALAVGSESYLTPTFDAQRACRLVVDNGVEAITLVPTILSRMLDTDAEALRSLRCIVTGGAPLSAQLALRTIDKLGDRLFNLYGTSEGGVAIMSSSADLRRYPTSIGRPLAGVKVRNANGARSELEIKSRWSVGGRWTPTGDNGYSNGEGYWFLVGRVDDMIVSGGVNVYPVELEQILLSHPSVDEVAVIGVEDDDFGKRLKAFVVLKKSEQITPPALKDWLTSTAERYLMPREIVLVADLPYNAAGKVDRRALSLNNCGQE